MDLEKVSDIILQCQFGKFVVNGLETVKILVAQLFAGLAGGVPLQNTLDGVEFFNVFWAE